MSRAVLSILLLQVGTTLLMVGLIWFVQIVHYPLFARVGPAEFATYEQLHQRRTTLVVAPLMLLELATATILVWLRPAGISPILLWTGMFLLVAIWLLTYFVQVPQHARLADGYDAVTQQKLVSGNWYRTLAWSARGLIVLAMLAQLIRYTPARATLTSGPM